MKKKIKDYFIKNSQIKFYKGYVQNISLEEKGIFLCLFDGGEVLVNKVINCSGKGDDDLIKQIINDKIGVKDIFNETLKENPAYNNIITSVSKFDELINNKPNCLDKLEQ